MAYTVGNCIADISDEVRTVIDGTSGSGADFDLLVRYIDQTHKDLLHSGPFRHALRRSENISTTAGTFNYTLTATNVRQIEAVYDRRSNQFLSPLVEVFDPSVLIEQRMPDGAPRPPLNLATHRVSKPFPQYYWLSTVVASGNNTHTLNVFPAPAESENTGTVTVYYSIQVPSVSGNSEALIVGEDGRDGMVAGVLYRVYSYLHNYDQMNRWFDIYRAIKSGGINS